MNQKKDKSPQGFYDPDIIDLLKVLNKDYETTSSCSGRVTLMSGVKKGQAKWVYKDHLQANFDKIFEIISNLKDDQSLRFIYEPLIVHVKCENIEKAQKLLGILHRNGFKKSCLISFKNFIIEINDTGKMETIVSKKLSKEYIKNLVDEANKRLLKTKENIKRLESALSTRVFTSGSH